MCHFGCWSHAWKSIKHSLLHQRRRWRKVMSALPGPVSGDHYLTGRDQSNWCLSRKQPGHLQASQQSQDGQNTVLGRRKGTPVPAGLGGVFPLCDAPLEPHHHGTRDAGWRFSPCWPSPSWTLLEHVVTTKTPFVSPWWTGAFGSYITQWVGSGPF